MGSAGLLFLQLGLHVVWCDGQQPGMARCCAPGVGTGLSWKAIWQYDFASAAWVAGHILTGCATLIRLGLSELHCPV